MSIGKVVSSFLGVREEHFYVHILDDKQAGDAMEMQPPGYSILRIEKPSDTNSHNQAHKIIATFKYKALVVHHIIEASVKVSTTSGSMLKCKTNPKTYRFLKKINDEFLPTVRLFVTEMINNCNFLENTDENNLNNELLYRKFIIYPEGQRVIVKRRLENEIHFASVGYNFKTMRFFADMNGTTVDVASFNQFLISDFLQIDISDKLLVRHALGYQRDVDLFTGKARDLSTLLSSESGSSVTKESEHNGPIIRSKDKDKILDRLRAAIGREEAKKIPHWKSPPAEVRRILGSILESVVVLHTVDEKMDWISRGVLDLIFQVLLRNGNSDESNNSIPIKIAKHLLHQNEEGCRLFGYNYISILSSDSTDSECVGIYQSIYVLSGLDSFRRLFVENLGMSRLIHIYGKISVLLLGEQANPMGDVGSCLNPDLSPCSSPRYSDEEFLEDSDEEYEDSITEEEESKKEEETAANPMLSVLLSPKGKQLLIPKLNLPTVAPLKSKNEEKIFNKTEAEFKRSATEELTSLATNLGETYMTGNLTALLSHLQDDSGVKARKEQVKLTGRQPANLVNDQGFLRSLINFRSSCYYKIKCWILRTLARVTERWDCLRYLPSPVNLLFSEVLVANKDHLLAQDEEFRSLLFKILSNYALYAEYCHSFRWKEVTRNMTRERVVLYRRKLDKFIWRVRNHLAPAADAREFGEIETHLTILVNYMTQCPTKITAIHVSDVCMETLLKIKDLAFSRGRITHDNMEYLVLVHRILQIFDQLIFLNTHEPLDAFLVSILFKNRETWRFYRHYSCQILFTKSIERSYITTMNRTQNARKELSRYREQVLFHYQCCVQLIQRRMEFFASEKKKQVPYSESLLATITEYLSYFEFLLHPTQGYLLRILADVKGTCLRFSLQKAILKFLITVFSIPDSIYIKSKAYIDFYISFAYLGFLKLYHNVQEDSETLELIYLHLQLLLTLARNKNKCIILKFYQLRAVDFLVRQVNLEYEITRKARTKPAPDVEPEPTFTLSMPPLAVSKKKKEKFRVKSMTLKDGKLKQRASVHSVFSVGTIKKSPLNRQKSASTGEKKGCLPVDFSLNDSPMPPPLKDHPFKSVTINEPDSLPSELSEEETDEYTDTASSEYTDVTESEEESEELFEEESEEEELETEEYEEEEEESEYETDSSEEILPTQKKRPSSVLIPKLSGCPIKGLVIEPKVAPKPVKPTPKPDVPKMKPVIPSLSNCPVKGEQTTGKSPDKQTTDPDLNLENEKPAGNLSRLERNVNTEDPKWQLIFEKMKSEETEAVDAANTDVEEVQFLYNQERHNRKIYNTQRIHISILQLLFSLMLTPSGTLDPLYSDQFPLDNKKLNIPFLLREHISHPANQNLIPPLVDETLKMGASHFRLLKLLCTQLFRKDIYNDLHRIAIGAYGTVYRCRLKPECQTMSVAIKLMEVPKHIHDRCVLHDIFDEILILDKFKDDNRISHTYDFGTDDDYYWITMKKYKCSLKNWRQKQTAPLQQNLALYLNIYMNVLNTFQFLLENSVNHFDVKCDNFLIQPLNEENWTPEDEENFWTPVSDVPNFSVCLADFGEAKFFSNEIDGYTTRNRGTEFTKSPEMLAVAYASQKTRSTYDRRKKVGASSPSDVWSLGCLLYELLTGEFLFYDQDWVRFFIRVTSPGQELITPEKMAKIDNNQVLVEFLLFILCRDPRMRPSIEDVIKRFKYVRGRLLSESTEKYSPRIPTPRDHSPGRLNRAGDVNEIENVGSPPRKSIPGSPMLRMATQSQPTPGASKLVPEPSLQPISPPISPTSTPPLSPTSEKAESPLLSHDPKKTNPLPLIHSISQTKLPIAGIKTVNIPDYFLKTTTIITDYILISPLDAASQRDHLKSIGITHIINCTNEPDIYSIEFLSMKIPLNPRKPKLLVAELDRVVSFINEAKVKKGKVLVYCENGTSSSAIVVIAYLMATRNWTYYESFVFVRNCRFVIDPDERFVKELCKYYQDKQRCNFQQYQCLCGACAFTVTHSFSQAYFENPISCCCTFERASPNCPNIGCFDFLEQMRRYYNYPVAEVMWGFSYISHIEGDFGKTTQEYVPTKDLLKEYPKDFVPKNWTVYKCRSCDFITHALRKTGPGIDTLKLGNFDAAVVTSIPVANAKKLI